MNQEAAHYERVHSLFEAARGLDAAERAAQLDAGCGSDQALRREVEELLGEPDAKANKVFEGHAGWESWKRLEWTYTWQPPKAEVVEFIIAFDEDSPWGRISAYFWQGAS